MNQIVLMTRLSDMNNLDLFIMVMLVHANEYSNKVYKYLFKLTDSLVWLPCARCSFFHVTLITNTNNMSRKQQIAKENRITIVALAKEGYSYRKIAEKLNITSCQFFFIILE